MPEDQWIVLELGPKAEGEDPDIVRASIRHSIRNAEVFIPASVTKMGDERVVQYLVEGYAFIKREHPDATYLRLEGTKYVNAVLRHSVTVSGARTTKALSVVGSDEIDRLRGQIREEVDQGIGVGDLVLITSGAYRQITARVSEEIQEHDAVQVHVKLRSKEAIVTLPRACLRLVQKAQRSPLLDRLDVFQSWLDGSRKLLGWPAEEVTRIVMPYQTFVRVTNWLLEGKRRQSFLKAFDAVPPLAPTLAEVLEQRKTFDRLTEWLRSYTPIRFGLDGLQAAPQLSLRSLRESADRWGMLSHWQTEGKRLSRSITMAYSDPPLHALDAGYLDWLWMQDVVERLDAVRSDVEGIEAIIRAGGKGMVQNLIIDGTQLAIRCTLSPGLGDLRDSKGRPNGGILGFCQSLNSLRKKYPTAAIYVTWDGSSQRRKKMFEGYKASRSTRSPMATWEIQSLRNILPKLGVFQAYNSEEEADDVIATLVRRRLKGRLNAFVTTDRDLLQLVTLTDHQFVPAVGSGSEKHYTVESVTHEYGVGPDQIVQVRALTGDSSDEIPGAVGFGLKTASKLVKLYGTVDRLFASNLAGLTPKQYSNLRAAEKQVKLNVELLRLHDDLALVIVGPDPDQTAAVERLREVDLKPESVSAFFPASGTSAHP